MYSKYHSSSVLRFDVLRLFCISFIHIEFTAGIDVQWYYSAWSTTEPGSIPGVNVRIVEPFMLFRVLGTVQVGGLPQPRIWDPE